MPRGITSLLSKQRRGGAGVTANAVQLRKSSLRAGLIVAALVLAAAAGTLIRHFALKRPAADVTLPALSISEWLAGHSTDWRMAGLKEHQGVLVIEFPGLAAQGAAMNRIAALLEKADAPRDRVLDDAQLAALIARVGDNSQTFYQGHDYDSSGLARFYALVQQQALKLTAQERRLQKQLQAAGLLAPTGEPPSNTSERSAWALITFTATQPDDPATPIDETVDAVRRASVLRHEISHGRFYVQPVYRLHCQRFWREVLSEGQRENIRSYLAGIGYDRHDEELMLNEAQAFMMNTADTRAFNAAGIGMTEDELAALRTRFWQTLPPENDGSSSALPANAPSAATRR
ncbi:MAG: hypothetical protein H7Z19_11505 [Chitinophagaceae bacterium]|nr:hypothetical protein [Rubrivivax sp.]